MQQHQEPHRSAVSEDIALQAAVAHEAEAAPQAAMENPAAGEQLPASASFDQMTGHPEVAAEVASGEVATDRPLANTDAMIEQLAHGMVAKDLDANDERFLAANGYDALPIVRGVHEFVMRTFLPTQAGKPPIVAFRGTVPTKVQTLIADIDPSGIGMYQFNPNRALIDGQIANAVAAGGQVISAGHSLGGALAQIAAATFPDRCQRIVTFQAPGVEAEMAQQIVNYNEQNPDQAIESTHHRVEGDLVPMGGEALTPGLVHNHKMTDGNIFQRNPLSKHVAMPLAQEEIAAGNEVPIHGDRQFAPTTTTTTEQDNQDKSQVIENIRTGIGHVFFGIGKLF